MPNPTLLENDPQHAEEIQMKITKVTNESLDSTRRIVAATRDADDIGTAALSNLYDQGEQLNKIEKDLRDNQEDIVEAQRTLQKIDACCWGCFMPCTRKPTKSNDFYTVNEVKRISDERRPILTSYDTPTQGEFICKYTNTPEEDEIEQNLQETSNLLGNLRNKALDIHTELVAGNDQLDQINHLVNDNAVKLEKAQESANKLLK